MSGLAFELGCLGAHFSQSQFTLQAEHRDILQNVGKALDRHTHYRYESVPLPEAMHRAAGEKAVHIKCVVGSGVRSSCEARRACACALQGRAELLEGD